LEGGLLGWGVRRYSGARNGGTEMTFHLTEPHPWQCVADHFQASILPLLERAAEAKSAPAALALARTYVPLTDRSAVRPDAPPDMAMARAWYEKAKDLGSTEAAQRLTQLPASVPATRPSPK